jgi:hypothetical protein
LEKRCGKSLLYCFLSGWVGGLSYSGMDHG